MLQLLLTTIALSFASSGIHKKVKRDPLARQACPAAKLKLRDCKLQIGIYKIQVWKEKFLIQDEFNRGMVDLPLKDSEWVEVSVQELGGKFYLEFIAWDAATGESEVASKKWYVYEIQGATLALRLEKLIQRRKSLGNDRFKYDRLEKYGLRVLGKAADKKRKVEWTVAREKGFLE
jgi:hypothetical protein